MPRIVWGQLPPEYYYGLDRGVLYFDDGAVPWNGLVDLNEKALAAVNSEYYYDGRKIRVGVETFDYAATVQVYTYPEKLDSSPHFGMSYRTQLGESYLLHLIYGAKATPNPMQWNTLTDSPSPSLITWDILADPVEIPGARPASHLTIDASVYPEATEQIEALLYGTDLTDPYLPSTSDIVSFFEDLTSFRVTYNGDGTYTAEGPDHLLEVVGDGSFNIFAQTAYLISDGKFQVSSY